MNASHAPRYCRCGTRLSRYHAGELCSQCERKRAAAQLEPPTLPDDFWETEQFADAFAAQHIGLVCRAYRKHPHHAATFGPAGIPQGTVGEWFKLTQAQISRIENGAPIRHLDNLAVWARTLRIPRHLLWFSLPKEPRAIPNVPAPSIRPSPSRPDARPPAALPNRNTDALAMHSFRAADKQVGGGHLYDTVVRYLHTEVAPRLFGDDQNMDGVQVFSAAAALTEMAGWMAHDAGRHSGAQQHFNRAYELAKVGDDHQLGAHILASMSHLAHHLEKPEQAIQLTHRGRKALSSGPKQPELEARLLALQARGCASLQQADDCVRLLMDAERALTATPTDPLSPWVSPFDEGSLASEAARCMRQLGDLSEAQRQAERIISARASDRPRSRAFGQLILITVLIAQGKPDEACALARDVLDATQSLSSYLVVQQLLDLKELLEPYRANATVADFLDCLNETLRERMWLYRWLTTTTRGHSDETKEGA